VDCKAVDLLCRKLGNLLAQVRNDNGLVPVDQKHFRFWKILNVHTRHARPNDSSERCGGETDARSSQTAI
jgi:hypothetical protein